MISLLPQRILHCLVFFLMKINLHLLFLSTVFFFFQLWCISFKIQDQTCLQQWKCTQTRKDCRGILIVLFALFHSVIPGLHLLFWQLLDLELLFSHSSYNQKALYSDWQQSAHSPLQLIRNQDCTLTSLQASSGWILSTLFVSLAYFSHLSLMHVCNHCFLLIKNKEIFFS